MPQEATELAAISSPRGKGISSGNVAITGQIDLPDRT